jgi:hypothetical protein
MTHCVAGFERAGYNLKTLGTGCARHDIVHLVLVLPDTPRSLTRPSLCARLGSRELGANHIMSFGSHSVKHKALATDRFSALATGAIAIVAAILLTALPPVGAAWLATSVALFTCAMFAPVAGLALLPWIAAFGASFTVSVHGLNMTPLDVLIAGLVLSALGRLWHSRAAAVAGGTRDGVAMILSRLRAAWRTQPGAVVLFAGLAAYLGVVALSLAVATDRVSTIKEIIKWCEVLAVVAAAAVLLRRPGAVRVVVWAMIGAGVAEALLGYVQWALSANAAQVAEAGRIFGTFGQPNPYAGYLNLSLPLALALVAFARDARERWLAAGAAVLVLGAEALSASRGGLIGLAAALVVIAAVGLRRERIAAILVGAGVIIGALALFTPLIPRRLTDLVLHPLRLDNVSPNAAITSANFSTMQRLAYWIAGLNMFAAHPILGVGAGNYDAAYARYAPNLGLWPEPLGHAHNYYINTAAETGLLGLAAFLVFAGGALLVAWRATHPLAHGPAAGQRTRRGRGTRAQAESGMSQPTRLVDHDARTLGQSVGVARTEAIGSRVPVRALAIGLFAVVVALMVHNLTDDLFVHGMDVEFGLAIACLVSLARTGYQHDTA